MLISETSTLNKNDNHRDTGGADGGQLTRQVHVLVLYTDDVYAHLLWDKPHSVMVLVDPTHLADIGQTTRTLCHSGQVVVTSADACNGEVCLITIHTNLFGLLLQGE